MWKVIIPLLGVVIIITSLNHRTAEQSKQAERRIAVWAEQAKQAKEAELRRARVAEQSMSAELQAQRAREHLEAEARAARIAAGVRPEDEQRQDTEKAIQQMEEGFRRAGIPVNTYREMGPQEVLCERDKVGCFRH
jgi:hypothetical protein